MESSKTIGITEVVLRDGIQSLLATRVPLRDLVSILPTLDKVGYWSLETWGGATYDSCIRYLNEDPWERLRTFNSLLENTPQQMLIRGQNLVGYKHYSNRVVSNFLEKSAENGIEIFRTFDALNDFENIDFTIREVKRIGMHAQGTIAYTTSPVHDLNTWLDLAKKIEDAGTQKIVVCEYDLEKSLLEGKFFDFKIVFENSTKVETNVSPKIIIYFDGTIEYLYFDEQVTYNTSEFDYKNNVLLSIPSNMPEPNDPNYSRSLVDLILNLSTNIDEKISILNDVWNNIIKSKIELNDFSFQSLKALSIFHLEQFYL